jgi:isopenicillin N synthase-like dioxygenase
LRFCHYRAAHTPVAVDGPSAPARRLAREVLFDQHTDSSLLTLSPLCTSGAGLQLMDASLSGCWVDAEETPGLSAADIEVHVGDFLSFLTANRFPPCLHRILRPAGGASRISMPLLLRCQPGHVLDTRPYTCDTRALCEAQRRSTTLCMVHGAL